MQDALPISVIHTEIDLRERRKLIKRLLLSTAEQEEKDFIRNQIKKFRYLKNLTEALKKITIGSDYYRLEGENVSCSDSLSMAYSQKGARKSRSNKASQFALGEV